MRLTIEVEIAPLPRRWNRVEANLPVFGWQMSVAEMGLLSGLA